MLLVVPISSRVELDSELSVVGTGSKSAISSHESTGVSSDGSNLLGGWLGCCCD